MRQMIDISEAEMRTFLDMCFCQTHKRKELIIEPYKVCNEVLFINQGMLRVFVIDQHGEEKTLHFALENQFVSNYASFLQKTISLQHIQALEPIEVVVLPRQTIEWGYQNMAQGDRMGRLIAEYYFVYFHNQITNIHTKSPKERYDMINEVFPNIHNRVPQHMIASYLGITSVHLSRLKKEDRAKT